VARLPGEISGDGDPALLLRRWTLDDAEVLWQAVSESAEHLRPWLRFMADEPLPIERRRELLAEWSSQWERGGDVHYAILAGGEVAGGAGLHRRRGPEILEIGYWVHRDHLGRGVATEASRLLRDAAFEVEGIEHVQIHCDRANKRSNAVPARLGFELIGEHEVPAEAPADEGIDCVWRISRADH
jgi:ribosomal-protein-serine acetyltransferase